jgi:predicted NACHT family NTPase
MKRRTLIKFAITAPILMSSTAHGSPAYTLIPIPATASELYTAINTLFSPIVDSSETVRPLSYGVGVRERELLKTMEPRLARRAWEMSVAQYEAGARRVFWRRIPEYKESRSYRDDSWMGELRMRVAYI